MKRRPIVHRTLTVIYGQRTSSSVVVIVPLLVPRTLGDALVGFTDQLPTSMHVGCDGGVGAILAANRAVLKRTGDVPPARRA